MDITAVKYQMINKLLQVNDELLLFTINNMLEYSLSNKETIGEPITDFWEELSDNQKIKVDLAIEELEEGKGIPHDEVMQEFRNLYKS